MLKLTGAVIILIATTIWGFLESDKLKKRYAGIKKIISGLVLLENEVSYGKRDIKTALMSIGEIQDIELFKNAAIYTESSGIKKGFCRALEKEKCILGTDKETLRILAENLGMTDSNAQINSIRHTKCLLESAEESAACEYEKSGKLYKSAGLLGGFAAVILLL